MLLRFLHAPLVAVDILSEAAEETSLVVLVVENWDTIAATTSLVAVVAVVDVVATLLESVVVMSVEDSVDASHYETDVGADFVDVVVGNCRTDYSVVVVDTVVAEDGWL